AGNTAMDTQTVTVQDNQSPVITAPADVTAPLNPGTCEASGINLGTPVVLDNCVDVTITNNAPAIYTAGITQITWTATDGSGNTSTAIQTVTVQDNELPVITAPTSITVPATIGLCHAIGVNLGTPVFSDNCAGAIISNNAPSVFPIGVTTVTWTVTDGAGNSATATQTVTVQDTQVPSISAPVNVYISTDADSCTATGVNLGTPVVYDNCPNFTVYNNAPAAFPLGSTIVIWTVTDAGGLTNIAYQVVNVQDHVAPVVTAPAPVTVPADTGSCTATNVNLGMATFFENCTNATITNNAPATFPVGVTTVTWSATDEEDNVGTATQTVTVIDNQPPVITAPPAITTVGNQNCQYVGLELGEPVVTDNCTGFTITNNAPAAFPLGTTIVTWTVTDAGGNTGTATQQVTIIMPPAPIADAEQQFCSGATVASLTAETGNVIWYNAETDGTVYDSATVLTNGVYYAATSIGGCESETRTPVNVTLITIPTPSGSSQQEFCNDAFIADIVTASENVVWYATEDSTTPLSDSLPLQDGAVYYGAIIDPDNGCESANRLAVTVTIHTGPVAIGRTEYMFCDTDMPTVSSLSANYAAGNWYSDEAGLELLEPSTPLEDDTVYYFRMFDAVTSCESPSPLAVTVQLIGCGVDSYNFLTPDNNDKNEYLAFKDLEYYPDNTLRVFDRQGRSIYQTSNYGQNNNYFTGTVNNKTL
ncbi:hypothetical protein VF10_38045, partial [Nostoc linckia z13]